MSREGVKATDSQGESDSMKQREDQVKLVMRLFKEEKLDKAFAFVKHPMALSQIVSMPESGGYHNVGHALGVAATAITLARESRIDPLHLAIAGLFHDAGHMRSATNPDHRNLALAAQRWMNFHSRSLVSHGHVDGVHVLSLILATNSAGKPSEQFTEEERIIYDADTLAGLGECSTVEALSAYQDGLRDEGYTGAMDPRDFVKMRGVYSRAGRAMSEEMKLL